MYAARLAGLSLLLLLVLVLPARAGQLLVGACARVVDGDTLVLETDAGNVRVRLYGIDAPERSQPFGAEAAAWLRDAAEGKVLKLDVIDRDRYDRAVALVYGPDDRAVNPEMVRAGWAWVYPRYCRIPGCEQWTAWQEEAKRDRRGLWAPAPIEPWEWRRRK